MGRFSERHGYVEPRTVIQTEYLDAETRTAVWNAIYDHSFRRYASNGFGLSETDEFVVAYWIEYHEPFDEIARTYSRDFARTAQDIVTHRALYEVFDFLEFCLDNMADSLSEALNDTFQKFLVGYRVVNRQIVPVTDDLEVDAIETALSDLEPFSGAQKHLQKALSLLSLRQQPQYANVVKESISAVEAVARHLTGEKTLGDALKKLDAKGVPTHRALVDGWLKLYGYTSAEGGIRHGNIEHGEVDEALATYFLVTCSSMVGYLIKKAGSTV
ncbi:AbiJ-NTD4 domain-containing protein [Paenarthrobacter sp. NPDC089316]|uniref:AbiJ-NTD4 domain-containing protein n=1 Tax=unclassified Paenarthrobacter TaxID=2634190 RepID=UPI00341E75F7